MIHRLAPNERAVVYMLGRASAVKGPGLVFTIPGLQAIRRVDVGETVVQVRNATIAFHVTDPIKALHEVADFREAMERLAETAAARAFTGRAAGDFALDRPAIAAAVRRDLEAAAAGWGLQVDKVEVNR